MTTRKDSKVTLTETVSLKCLSMRERERERERQRERERVLDIEEKIIQNYFVTKFIYLFCCMNFLQI